MDTTHLQFDSAYVLSYLQQLLDQVGPQGMAPALAEIGETLTENAKQRFSTSTGPDGQRWKSNAEATFISYIESRKGFSPKTGKIIAKGSALAMNKHPLVESGLLRDTLHWQPLGEGMGLEIGTNRFAGEWDGGAAVHQFGSLDGHIPARPFLGFSTTDKQDVLDILIRHLIP